jgi:predicted RecA/RadA family phage recombinase
MDALQTRTFWLSFVDPESGKNLGVAIVDVTEADVTVLLAEGFHTRFPKAKPGAEWIAAATRVAWAHNCNPGGQVGSAELTGDAALLAHAPRNRLMDRPELEARGLVAAREVAH